MNQEKQYIFDKPENVNRLIKALLIVCAVLFVADFFYHKHVHYGFEEFPGFFALYGFIMCVLLVLAAKVMRVFLKRDEDYYDR